MVCSMSGDSAVVPKAKVACQGQGQIGITCSPPRRPELWEATDHCHDNKPTKRGNGPPGNTKCDGPVLERGQCISGEDSRVFDCSALHQVELPERSSQERRGAVLVPLCGAIPACTQVQHAEEGAPYRCGMSDKKKQWAGFEADKV